MAILHIADHTHVALVKPWALQDFVRKKGFNISSIFLNMTILEFPRIPSLAASFTQHAASQHQPAAFLRETVLRVVVLRGALFRAALVFNADFKSVAVKPCSLHFSNTSSKSVLRSCARISADFAALSALILFNFSCTSFSSACIFASSARGSCVAVVICFP